MTCPATESLPTDRTPPHSPTLCELLSPTCALIFLCGFSTPQESAYMSANCISIHLAS